MIHTRIYKEINFKVDESSFLQICVKKYIKIYFFKSLEFPTELNDFDKLFLQNF